MTPIDCGWRRRAGGRLFAAGAAGLALLLAGGCAPREPYTVDTRLGPEELVRTPGQAPALCQVADTAVQQRVAIPDTPRWFFKPFAEQPWVAYASEAGNNLIALDTGYVIPVPGDRDPVPTPDERYLTNPGVFLTRVDDLTDPARRAQPRRLLADLDGEYQSPALLREHGDERVYRFMIGRYSPTVRDFRVWTDTTGVEQIAPLAPPWRPCPGRRLHLPMLSKGGDEFGAYDVAAGSTRLFALGEDGACEMRDDLGMPTGKVSFSFDARYVTFHLAILDQASTALAENPDDHWTSNVFVYDRETRRLGRVTHHTAGNAYYPAFRRDGRIVFLFKPPDDSYGRFSFAVADPARIDRWLPLRWYTRECAPGDGRCLRTLALGALWGYTCSRHGADLNPRLAALNTLSLSAAGCRDLVGEHWLTHRRFVAQGALRELADAGSLLGVEPAELLAMCPR